MTTDTATAGESKRGAYRRALATPDFRWLSLGLAVSMIGSWAYNVALYVYVYDVTQSASWAAAVTLGRFVPSLILGTYGGVVAERRERRGLLITLDLLSTAIMVGLTVVAAADLGALAAIVLAGITSVLGTAYYPATAAMTPQIVSEDDLAAANSFNSMIENLSVIVGPALGAGILAISSTSTAFLVNAATFLFSAWASSRLQTRSEPTDVTEGGEAGILKQVSVGFRAISSSSTAAILVGASVLASFLYGVDTVLFVVVSEERLGLGPDGFGLLLAGLGVGGVLMAPLVDRLAGGTRLSSVISLGLIAYTLPTLLLVWVDAPAAAFAIQVVRGAGTLVVDVLAVTALQRSLESDLIARVFGVFMSLVLAGISLGALITAPLLNATSLDTTLVVFSAVIAGLVVLAYPLTRIVDRETAARLAELEPRISALEALGIFANANRTALERLAQAAEEQSLPVGTRIVTQGDEADALYVILDGNVAVTVRDPAEWVHARPREERHVRDMGPGQYFGEIGLIERVPRTASVDAATDVTLLRIPGDDFIDALTTNRATAAFLEGARMRLAHTHPARELTAPALRTDDA